MRVGSKRHDKNYDKSTRMWFCSDCRKEASSAEGLGVHCSAPAQQPEVAKSTARVERASFVREPFGIYPQ